jgi:hypothetical protein
MAKDNRLALSTWSAPATSQPSATRSTTTEHRLVSGDSGSSFLPLNLAHSAVLPTHFARVLVVPGWRVARGPRRLRANGDQCRGHHPRCEDPPQLRPHTHDRARSIGAVRGIHDPQAALAGDQDCHSKFLIPGQRAHSEDDALSQDTSKSATYHENRDTTTVSIRLSHRRKRPPLPAIINKTPRRSSSR